MGRAASNITLECALQTHPTVTLIGTSNAAGQGAALDIQRDRALPSPSLAGLCLRCNLRGVPVAQHTRPSCPHSHSAHTHAAGEEVAARRQNLASIVEEITHVIVDRAAAGKHHAVILVPEGERAH